MADVPRVGGKNASLGEMIGNLSGMGVKVPGGFATTAQAFWDFLDHNDLRARINARLAALDVADVTELARAVPRFAPGWKRRPCRPCWRPAARGVSRPRQRGVGGGTLVRHRGRPAGCLVCRAAGNLSACARRG